MARSRGIANTTAEEDSDFPRTRRRRPRRVVEDGSDCDASDTRAAGLVPKTQSVVKTKRTQVKLGGLADSNSLTTAPIMEDLRKVSSTRRRVEKRVPKKTASPELPEPDHLDGDQEEEFDIEESIWCGSIDESESSSGEELLSPRKLFALPRKTKDEAKRPAPDLTKQLQALKIFDDDEKKLSPKKRAPPSKKPNTTSRPTSSSDKENSGGIMTFSPPPRFQKPPKGETTERPSTPPPPASPSKSKLQSPSKKAPRIPTPPLRPSLDAFWTADAINDWNDQYSPQKPLKSPRKLNLKPHSENASPTTSPSKTSPTKRTKAEIAIRKTFDSTKETLASSFLSELDETITQNRISTLSASTGGIHLTWSKTLNTTAGRANWRRETTKSPSSNNPIVKHFASIELASKVVSNEHQLLNVLAHEFCHLCNFMISGVKDQPHGKSFKEWGKKCTAAFADRGVEVTTKHSYEIDFKYIWSCGDCEMEFKRHSRSIDPTRQRCGSCRGMLVQVKPAPRKVKDSGTGDGKGEGTPVSGYAAFVKMHFAELKKGMVGASHKEVMEALGRKYRAEKDTAGGEKKPNVASIAIGLEDMKLGSSGSSLVIELD